MQRAGTLVQVRDTGQGIDHDERGKMVKRFHRSPATQDVAGIGLLGMAATIVDLHGFSLDTGDADPGAIFTICQKPTSVGAFL